MEALDIANNGLTKQTVRETNLKWNQISTNNCIMSKCHYKNECAYFKMRNKLKREIDILDSMNISRKS